MEKLINLFNVYENNLNKKLLIIQKDKKINI